MSISMNGISGTDYSSIINQTQTGKLEETINKTDKENTSTDEMMEACKEFEAYMIEQIYKSMEKTIIKADDEENEYQEYFGDMQIQEYAKTAVEQGGFGLANQLYEAMLNNQGPKTIADADGE